MSLSLRAVTRFPRRYLEQVREVREGFAPGSGQNPVMNRFHRPISFFLTPVVVNLGFSPNQVTYVSGGLGIASLVLFALGGQGPWVLGLALFNVYRVLDAVDGNVARVTDRATYLGKFFDGAIDALLLSLLPAAIGLGLYIATDRFVWFIIGAVNCVVILFSLYVMTRFSFHREWLKADYLQGTLGDAPRPDREQGPRGLSIPGSLLYSYLFVGLIVSAIVDLRAAFLVGYLILSASWGALVVWNHSFAARRALNVHRVSRHSANRGPGPNGLPAATRPEIAGREAGGLVIWVTGLSGSGKTTLCNALEVLLKPSTPELVIIDGDTIRQAFGDSLGYREEDRVLQIKRLQRIASMLSEQGLVVLVAALYAHPELLAWNRKNLRNYHEVYLEASVETVRRRDPKGLYNGATQHVVGIDIPWHAPVSPDVTINVDDPDRPEALARRVIRSMPRFERMQEAR